MIRPVSQQLYQWSKMHVREVCSRIILTSLRVPSEDFRNTNFEQLLHAQIEEDWGHEVCGLLLGYDHNVLIESTFIKVQNKLRYYCQPFHNPTSVEHLRPDCKVEYPNANQGIMPEAHNICVQYMQSAESYFDNTF
jgi:hypothetical protein